MEKCISTGDFRGGVSWGRVQSGTKRERKDNQIHYIEVAFYDRNYQHLTGLELIDDEGNILKHQAKNFYRKCIENKLSIKEIQFKDDGTTQLKLAALDSLTDTPSQVLAILEKGVDDNNIYSTVKHLCDIHFCK